MEEKRAALAPNIQRIKKKAMDACKENEHRMTRFNGHLIHLGNESFFSALCKDCYRSVRVYADGTINGDAFDTNCCVPVATSAAA